MPNPTRISRGDPIYKLAMDYVFVSQALERANKLLNKSGQLGVLPDMVPSSKSGSTFHCEVRRIVRNSSGPISFENLVDINRGLTGFGPMDQNYKKALEKGERGQCEHVALAKHLAQTYHGKSKGRNGRYNIDHIAQAAGLAHDASDPDNWIVLCMVWLHDIIEKTNGTVSYSMLRDAYVDPYVIQGVIRLTKTHHRPWTNYIVDMLPHPCVVKAKIADMRINLLGQPSDRQLEKYWKAFSLMKVPVKDAKKWFLDGGHTPPVR